MPIDELGELFHAHTSFSGLYWPEGTASHGPESYSRGNKNPTSFLFYSMLRMLNFM